MKKFISKHDSEAESQSTLLWHTLKWLITIPLILGFLLRICLLFNSQTKVSFGALDWFNIFALGFINDMAVAFVCTLFIAICIFTLNYKKYSQPWGSIIFGLLLIALIYVFCFHTIFDEYGSAVPKIVKILLTYKVISFGLRLFLPRIRQQWSYILYLAILFITFFIMLVSISGEWFFWDEFGVRYNFIAVDYLIYTHEVIGNILESYAIIPLFSVLAVISGVLTWFVSRYKYPSFSSYSTFKDRISPITIYIAIFLGALFHLSLAPSYENSPNIYVNELQANGIDKFYRAFFDNKLNFKDFYLTLPQKMAVEVINKQYGSTGNDNRHAVTSNGPEIYKNIILITEESLSGSYLTRYGNEKHLTPNLDRLMNEGIAFDSLYATGNRTVRGLEALTLCLPPCPGESVIKQPNNANLFSVGTILRSKGYNTQFLYGGNAYFDNMATFYKNNGYQIIDKGNIDDSKVHFSNIWGVCDEDIFNKAIEVMQKNMATRKPTFLHIMTVSNHRPFTYPENRIDISPKKKSRDGGVKYADYAIGKFIADAKNKPWFKNTVIIIVADHCASSAGETEIPLDKYQIPALIYSPGFIAPQSFKKITSQIDIMPTVFGLLHFNYLSYFFGQDVLKQNYQPRALMATYENLGYLEDNKLVVLSTGKKLDQFIVQHNNGEYIETKTSNSYTPITLRAIANYQAASNK